MIWDAEAYFKASQEHLNEAWVLFGMDLTTVSLPNAPDWVQQSGADKRYLYAHYWAGISIECMLRAYQWRLNREWDGRHDLIELFRAGFERVVPRALAIETSTLLNDVMRRWNSNHRYATPDMLRKSLRDKDIDVQQQGDRLKNNARRMCNCADQVVSVGRARWR